MKRLNSGREAQRTEIARQYRVNEFYDLIAPNGLVIGQVRYGFFNGEHWCFAFKLTTGQDTHGTPKGEYDDFDMQWTPAPWQAPVVRPNTSSSTAADLSSLPGAAPSTKQLPPPASVACLPSSTSESSD